MGWLLSLFIVLPLVDLWLLLAIGEALGFWPTVGMTIGIALFGAYFGKREGLRVLAQWRQAMAELRMPEDGLVSGALVLVGAVLLVTPGVITDAIGLLCLLPPSRALLAKIVRAALADRMQRAVERGSLRVNVVSFHASDFEPIVEDPGSVIDAHGEEVVEVAQRALPPHRGEPS